MTRLPRVSVAAAPAWQRERLAEWMQEWRIECILKDDEGDSPVSASPWSECQPERGSPAGDERLSDPPRIGQIRLLHPGSTAARRPVYVAILAHQAPHSFLAAPYGRFSEPATPGELLTGRTSAALRVLCVWNVRSLAADILARSWAVDEMPSDELDDARLVLKSLESGKPPDRLARRVGPPLAHPADPRHAYEDEEAEWAADFETGTLHGLSQSGMTYDFPARNQSELPKAAEPGEEYENTDPSGSEC